MTDSICPAWADPKLWAAKYAKPRAAPVVAHERPAQRITMLNCWVRVGDFETARHQLNRVIKR